MRNYFNNLYLKDSKTFYKELKKNLKANKKMFIITVNPESFMLAKKNVELEQIILDKNNTVVADGIGIIKGAKKLKLEVPHKIVGVEISEKLLEYGNQFHKTIFLLGATEEVNKMLVEKINNNYPKLKIVGSYHGYIPDKEEKIKEVLDNGADIVMVALGIPKQELLINSIYSKAKKGIFIGVGGSFDIISGSKKRAPKLFLKTNTEWLYRIVREPKRLSRFYQNNIKFLFKLK